MWSRKSFYLYPILPSCHGDLQFVPSLFSENSRGFAVRATHRQRKGQDHVCGETTHTKTRKREGYMRASLVFRNQYFMEFTLYRLCLFAFLPPRGSPSLGLLETPQETPQRHDALTKGRGTPGAGLGIVWVSPHPRGSGSCVHRGHVSAVCLQCVLSPRRFPSFELRVLPD